MRFIYGDFQGLESDNWACTAAQKVGVRKNGELTSIVASFDFQAVVVAADQYALSARMAAIQNGILYDGRNVGLVHDNGTPSRLYLDSSQSQSGVRITRYPFPEPNIAGADYASSLTCRCSFEAEYSAPQVGGGGGISNVLVSFVESLGVTGNGGARTAVQEYITGDPEKFTLADKTAVYATQTGAAVVEGFSRNFYQVSSPLFPGLLLNDSVGERRTITELTNGKFSCAIEWEYKFESTSPIDGTVFA
jgi:hypothetical protein